MSVRFPRSSHGLALFHYAYDNVLAFWFRILSHNKMVTFALFYYFALWLFFVFFPCFFFSSLLISSTFVCLFVVSGVVADIIIVAVVVVIFHLFSSELFLFIDSQEDFVSKDFDDNGISFILLTIIEFTFLFFSLLSLRFSRFFLFWSWFLFYFIFLSIVCLSVACYFAVATWEHLTVVSKL